MLEDVHPAFLTIVSLVFGVQALWGVASGNFLTRDGLQLAVVSKTDRPLEFKAVTTVYAFTAAAAFGMLILKGWNQL